MPSLPELLTKGDVRRRVIDDCCQLIEDEVRRKSGLTGMALKAGFKAFKAVKPGALATAVDNLLDEFAEAADPFYQDHVKSKPGRPVTETFGPRAHEIAGGLLVITDRRAERFDSGVVKKTYQKLRPSAVRHTEEAIPGVARLIDKHTAEQG
jgi:hypothetical protein